MNQPTLPRWDMTPVFPSPESPEFQQEFAAVTSEIASIVALADSYAVRRREDAEVTAEFALAFDILTEKFNALRQRIRTLYSYLGCFTSTDAKNEFAQARESELNTQYIPLGQLVTRYIAWIGTSDVEKLFALSAIARDHAYFVRRCAVMARHQMSEAEEALASELSPASISGWSRLHSNTSALLSSEVPFHGEARLLPISAVRALANDPDREVRKSAFEAEQKSWEAVEVPMAAALNGVKGYQQVLRKRRGYADDIEPTLFDNYIDRATLDAMQQACVESFPDFQRYQRAKARALGLDHLAWYDLNAPLGATTRVWTWPEAEAIIMENFGQYSARLADFAARSFRERWIDAEPRVGKEGGAFCTGILPGVSRIMMNFDGSFNAVSTLAHELGHAYHNLNLAHRTTLQRSTPSTLAETASIFCETLTFDAAIARAQADEQLALLDTVLQRNLSVVVDIHSRFLFEKAVFEKRAVRDLTIAEFKALITDAQRQTYGNELDPLHPYMWAVKGHYYGPTFYNYPYTFGLLFALGLYAIFQKQPDAFRADYDDFLSSTGLADARTLAQKFHIDITRIDFWRSSLDVIRADIARFEKLV